MHLLNVAMERHGRIPFLEQKSISTGFNIINVFVSSLKLPPVIYFAIVTKFGFSQQIYIKINNVNPDEKSKIESRVGTCRETDGRTDGQV
jgi:hypothetical protein